jgi:hypothetical protein
MALPPHRDTQIHTLSAWTLINDGGYWDPGAANAGREFAGNDMPKQRFMFTVSFETDPHLNINPGSDDLSENQYACKTASRPNITFTYQDVNAYNYRFKVKTKADYGTVTVSFYDDNKNTAHNLFRNYLMAVSPIALQMSGGSYYDQNSLLQRWASIGPLPNECPDGLIRTMRVAHHYSDAMITDDSAHQQVFYDYINPKVQSFVLDDLDMSTSDAPLITITFVYDSVNIFYSDPTMDTVADLGPVPEVTVGGVETIR